MRWTTPDDSTVQDIRRALGPSIVLLFASGMVADAHRAVGFARSVGVTTKIALLTLRPADCHATFLPCICTRATARPGHQFLETRVKWLHRLFRGGVDVFQLDLDVIWYKNPFDLFARHPNASLLSAADGKLGNAGVFFARHSTRAADRVATRLLGEWSRRMDTAGGDEQGTLHDVLAGTILRSPFFSEQMSPADRRATRQGWERPIMRANRCSSETRCWRVEGGLEYVAFAKDFTYGQFLGRDLCAGMTPHLVHLSGYPSKTLRPLILNATLAVRRGMRPPIVPIEYARRQMADLADAGRVVFVEEPAPMTGPFSPGAMRFVSPFDVFPIHCERGRLVSLVLPYSTHGHRPPQRALRLEHEIISAPPLDESARGAATHTLPSLHRPATRRRFATRALQRLVRR